MTPPANLAPIAASLLAAARFDEHGLLPVIAQDRRTGVVRMFAWANREALEQTLQTGQAHFWSRSRQALWRKGESSGNSLAVHDIRLDCDGDVALYLVDAEGPSCHTGRTSCFYRGLGDVLEPGRGAAPADRGTEQGAPLREDDGPPDPPSVVMARVAEVIAHRRRHRPDKSYVVSLLDGGWPKILGKIREEASELVEALPQGDADHTAHEAADLMFHLLVGLEAAGVPATDVFAQLRRRFGVSGLEEKARRARPPSGEEGGPEPKPGTGPRK